MELIADPASNRNRHRIEAVGAFDRFAIELENAPLPANPKSSFLTALSLVRLIESQVGTLVVCDPVDIWAA
ncbi:DUF108 domain-containing protein [Mesorhizobium sp. AR10]|uniref:aspartate dehydrogenase domain-containing protein n=1 Tax=Mesorhizobium sp. AR10 TaxID=2865839 RepID=UPI00220AEAC7|nr:DUF108 domain-containing protein [Mesorhizobium sp. AR10]